MSIETASKANPLVGTWKANLSKSHRHPNHQFQSAKLHFETSGEEILLTFSGVNAKGEEESGTRTILPDGLERPIPGTAGVVTVAKWLDSGVLQTLAMKDGAVVGEGSYAVSPDGTTLAATVKGTDASGSAFEQVIVFDRA